jgi:arsenate reductase
LVDVLGFRLAFRSREQHDHDGFGEKKLQGHNMESFNRLQMLLLLLMVPLLASAVEPAPVLMVCEHGSVKSVMAASLFNQGAAERRLPFRAIARGVTPDAAVPARIAAELGKEGVDVRSFVPVRVSGADVSSASRVVAIGIDATVLSSDPKVRIDSWSDVPAASENYGAARAALKAHVDALLTELQQSQKK